MGEHDESSDLRRVRSGFILAKELPGQCRW